MKIFITGGSGFIGQALCQALLAQGHQLTVLTRKPPPQTAKQAVSFVSDFTTVDSFDAVINLAGEPIFAKRWTAKQKQILYNSRIDLTDKLARLIRQSPTPPKVLISASATGYYGNLPQNTKNADEQTACGTQFPAQLCQHWEAAALQAQSEQTRVCLLRTGIVLDEKGGALAKMRPLYRLGMGGKLGNGKQHWAWISLKDQVRAILFLLEQDQCFGAYNLVAPYPVSNADFNYWLAKKVRRPAYFHTPKWILRLVLGERSQLLLDNQPLAPTRLLEAGFEFIDKKLRLHR